MKPTKKLTMIFILVLIISVAFIGCSDVLSSKVSEKSIFKIESCDSIQLRIGSLEYKTEKKNEIDSILNLFKSLNFKKVNIQDPEGGILVILDTPDGKTNINVCGKKILYYSKWYEVDEDISYKLQEFFN